MGCASGLCSAQNVFVFINITFAMYSGALLSTAARLAWDPSTYTWFRFLCAAQYHASLAYVLAAGLWLAALVYLAAATSHRAAPACLHAYAAGVAALAISEVAFGAWMATSLMAWWREAPQAELARRGIDLLHDIKPALLAVERYKEVARPLYDMIMEVEARAPNNAVIIAIFAIIAIFLQIAAVVVARRLARSRGGCAETCGDEEARRGGAGVTSEEDSDSEALDSPLKAAPAPAPPGWHKSANLRMYTILDKIF